MQFDDVLEPQERTLTLPARVWLELERLMGGRGSVETAILWLLEKNRRGREWEEDF